MREPRSNLLPRLRSSNEPPSPRAHPTLPGPRPPPVAPLRRPSRCYGLRLWSATAKGKPRREVRRGTRRGLARRPPVYRALDHPHSSVSSPSGQGSSAPPSSSVKKKRVIWPHAAHYSGGGNASPRCIGSPISNLTRSPGAIPHSSQLPPSPSSFLNPSLSARHGSAPQAVLCIKYCVLSPISCQSTGKAASDGRGWRWRD